MTAEDKKVLLEMEQIRQDIQLGMKQFDMKYQAQQKQYEAEQKQYDIKHEAQQKQFDKKHHNEGLRLALYGLAVGAGGTFAIAKTLQLLGFG